MSLRDRKTGKSYPILMRLPWVPDLLFNQLLWKAIRGEVSEMPAPRRAAWLKNLENGEDDEEN